MTDPIFDAQKNQEELEAQMFQAPLFEGELPVFYDHGMTVIGTASGIQLPNLTVVLRVTMRAEAGRKIIDMLNGRIPLALGWHLREIGPIARRS